MFADFLGFELQQILAGPAQHARRSFRSTGRMYAGPGPRINMPGLSAASVGSDLPLPSHSAAPAPLALPDSFHGVPARARTEALVGRAPLPIKSLVATRPVATAVEKNYE